MVIETEPRRAMTFGERRWRHDGEAGRHLSLRTDMLCVRDARFVVSKPTVSWVESVRIRSDTRCNWSNLSSRARYGHSRLAKEKASAKSTFRGCRNTSRSDGVGCRNHRRSLLSAARAGLEGVVKRG